MSVHVGVTGPDGEPIAGWTTTDTGEHIPDPDPTDDLTLRELRTANVSRVAKWHPPESVPWTLADWSNAAAGELGEAANVVKKIRRIETGVPGNQDPDMDVLVGMLADEIADTIIYLDLLAFHAGIDLPVAVREKFNRVSRREGFEETL